MLISPAQHPRAASHLPRLRGIAALLTDKSLLRPSLATTMGPIQGIGTLSMAPPVSTSIPRLLDLLMFRPPLTPPQIPRTLLLSTSRSLRHPRSASLPHQQHSTDLRSPSSETHLSSSIHSTSSGLIRALPVLQARSASIGSHSQTSGAGLRRRYLPRTIASPASGPTTSRLLRRTSPLKATRSST